MRFLPTRGKGQRRQAGSSVRNCNTGSRCAGVLRCVGEEELVDKDEAPSNAGERLQRQRLSARDRVQAAVAWGVGLQNGGGFQQLKRGPLQRLGEAATACKVESVRPHTGGCHAGAPGHGAAEEPVGEDKAPSNAVEMPRRQILLSLRPHMVSQRVAEW